MKKQLFSITLLAVMASACTSIIPDVKEVKGFYLGKVIVDEPLYEQENVKVIIDRDSVTGARNIVMYQVRFSERMPVTIDMVIPDVQIDANQHITGDSIIPMLKSGAPYEKYLVTKLEGDIIGTYDNPQSLRFHLNFGKYPTTYSGKWTVDTK